MNNSIINDRDKIEQYIKMNIKYNKSNPTFNKIYFNQFDKFFTDWNGTTETATPSSSNASNELYLVNPYISSIITSNGYLYLAPFSNAAISHRIDLNNMSITKINNISTYSPYFDQFSGCVSYRNKIYYLPCRRHPLGYRVHVNERGNFATHASFGDTTMSSLPSTAQYYYVGGCLDKQNRIWFTPNDHSDFTGSGYDSGHFHYWDITTGNYNHITDAGMRTYFTADSYSGAIYVDNKVYFIPRNAINSKSLLYYLDVSSTPTFVSYNNTVYGTPNSSHIYRGGVLFDKKIYLIPSTIPTANNVIHYIDTTNNTIGAIPNLTGVNINATNSYWGGCLAPDGYIYFAPYSNSIFTTNPTLHRINVLTGLLETYSIKGNEYYRYNSANTKVSITVASGYFSGCNYYDGRIYFTPNYNSNGVGDYPFLAYLDLNLDKGWNSSIKLLDNPV